MKATVLAFLLILTIIISVLLYIIGYNLLLGNPYANKMRASAPQTFSFHAPVNHFSISTLPRLHSLNCSRALAPDDPHIKEVLGHGRITMISDPTTENDLDMCCTAIWARWKFAREPTSKMEAEFPIAYARTVYKDYLLIEQMLAVEYAPQNFYCYAIDAKAPALFRNRIHAMASCFPNVFVAPLEFDVQSNGKNVSRSHLACLRQLAGIDRKKEDGGIRWKYAILLQNQDIPIRTNAEMVEMLTVYNGTNEVGTLHITIGSIKADLDWSLESLKLYKDGSNPWPPGEQMHHTKSLNLVALSRAAVDFMVDRLHLDTFIDRLEATWYGMDEVFISSLNTNLPDFPGGYSWKCLEEQQCEQEPMSRYVIWNRWKPDRCLSGYFRHGVCVMGLEDIWRLGQLRFYFYANKMLPEFDYAAIHCWLHELALRKMEQCHQMDNSSRKGRNGMAKTGGGRRSRLNLNMIAKLPHVRYNRLRAIGRLDKFHC